LAGGKIINFIVIYVIIILHPYPYLTLNINNFPTLSLQVSVKSRLAASGARLVNTAHHCNGEHLGTCIGESLNCNAFHPLNKLEVLRKCFLTGIPKRKNMRLSRWLIYCSMCGPITNEIRSIDMASLCSQIDHLGSLTLLKGRIPTYYYNLAPPVYCRCGPVSAKDMTGAAESDTFFGEVLPVALSSPDGVP
jgi:hypothetical protein